MSSSTNRASVLTKTHRVLKKHYKPVAAPSDRPLLEHLLYGCLLEGANYEQADEAFALLQQSYFDWNEVRVTTIGELAEVMSMLPDAPVAARRMKRVLHHAFETYFSFDLEFLKKENLGKAAKDIERLNGVTPFVLAYFVQSGLGGHAIPVGDAELMILHSVGAISEKDMKKHQAPGLERAIPKAKGVEFGSLLHQISVDFIKSPFSNKTRGILTDIADDAKERLPKRGQKVQIEPKKKRKPKKTTPQDAQKVAAKKSAKKKAAAAKQKAKSAAPKSTKKSATAKSTAKSKTTKSSKSQQKKTTKKSAKKTTSKKSDTKRLTKKKPR